MEGHDVTFIKTDGGDINFTAVSDQDAFVKERATFVFNSSKTLVATYWRPKVEVKAGMFLCHGYGEYISPIYDELAEFLSSHGILVFGHDHVGHGRSSGQRVQVRFSNFCSFEEVFSHWVVITVMCVRALKNFDRFNLRGLDWVHLKNTSVATYEILLIWPLFFISPSFSNSYVPLAPTCKCISLLLIMVGKPPSSWPPQST